MFDDHTKPMHVDDVLLGTLLLLAPTEVREHVLSQIRRHVSVVAADKAKGVMDAVDMAGGLAQFFELAKKDLCPSLRGPTDGTVDTEDDLLVELATKIMSGKVPFSVVTLDPTTGVVEMAHTLNADPNAFSEPTKDCDCIRCKHIRDLENKGLRVKNNGTTVPFDRLN